ncbi:MAG: flippase, partial [Flavobacteriales bacterium]|nr:flippase [Flavobacteriales bacterium]
MIRTEGFRKYFKNTSWLFSERVLRLLISLVVGVYVARYLGESLLGKLSYATGFIGLFFSLTGMGVDAILSRDLVKHPERRDLLLGSAAVIKLFGSLIFLVIVVGATFIKDMEPLTASLIVIIALAELFRPFGVIEFQFMAEVQARKAVHVQLGQLIVSAIVKVVLVLIEAPLIYFAWVYVLESFLLSVGYVWLYERAHHVRSWRVDRSMLRYLLVQSWPMLIYSVALHFQARVDQVMIGDMLMSRAGEMEAFSEVGQYSVALKMIETFGFLPVVVQMSLAPAITRAKVESEELYADRLLNQYRLMFMLFLVTSIPLFLIAEPVVVLL